jgi:hypothetical protein
MASTEVEPVDEPGTAWYPGRTVAVVQDPDWTRASVPANPDRPWEVWFARIIYAPRQFFRFALWSTESIYKLALVLGTALMIWLMIHS